MVKIKETIFILGFERLVVFLAEKYRH